LEKSTVNIPKKTSLTIMGQSLLKEIAPSPMAKSRNAFWGRIIISIHFF
jgi:hypothetical protein